MLDTCASECCVKQRANHNAVGQPIVQEEHNIRDNIKRLGSHEHFVSVRSRRQLAFDTREIAIIDVGNRSDVEVHCGLYCYNREYGHGVEYEPPLDALPFSVAGVGQRGDTFEEQCDDNS